jgi:hypothetical protein
MHAIAIGIRRASDVLSRRVFMHANSGPSKTTIDERASRGWCSAHASDASAAGTGGDDLGRQRLDNATAIRALTASTAFADTARLTPRVRVPMMAPSVRSLATVVVVDGTAIDAPE